MSAGLWLLVALPAVAGAGLLLAGQRAERVAAPVALLVAGAVVGLAGVVAVARPSVAVAFMADSEVGLAVDALAALVAVAVAAVTFLVLVFAAAEGTAAPARFFGLMLLFTAAVLITVTATTLVTLLFAWEIMGATSYALIGFQWQRQAKVSAGLTAFLVTRTADLGLYLAAGAALAGGTGLILADLAQAPGPWRDVIAAGFLVATAGKAAQLPFSFWLSRAMAGPSTVSALLHSAAMVAMGGYILLRMTPLLQATGWAGPAAAWLGAITAVVLGVVALAQHDLKQLLAASTAAQLGFVVMGAGLGATAGGAAHLVAHAATKALLFLVAGAWLTALGTKQLRSLRGAGRRWPVVGVAVAAGALALAGIAPLALWATKDALLAAARDSSLYFVALLAAVLAAGYAGKVLVIVLQHSAPPADAAVRSADLEQTPTGQINRWAQAPLVVLAAGAAGLGVLALPPAGAWLRRALGDTAATPDVWEMVVSGGLAAGVVALVATGRRLPVPRSAVGWFGLERAAHTVIVRPTLTIAHALARFDDQVVDRAVHGTTRGGLELARAAGRVDRRGIDAAVVGLGAGVRRLARWSRVAQGGHVHIYYAQLVAVLLGAALLMVLVR